RILRLNLGDEALRAKARAKLDEERSETANNKERYSQILQAVEAANEAVKQELGKDSYTKEEVMAIESQDPAMQQHVGVLMQMFTFKESIPEVIEELNDGLTYFT